MAVPLGGVGKRLDDMNEWHRSHGIQLRHGRGRTKMIATSSVGALLIQTPLPPLLLSSVARSSVISERSL
jgi:hypothetical protein